MSYEDFIDGLGKKEKSIKKKKKKAVLKTPTKIEESVVVPKKKENLAEAATKFVPNNLKANDIGIDVNALAANLKADPIFMSKMRPNPSMQIGSGLGHKEVVQIIASETSSSGLLLAAESTSLVIERDTTINGDLDVIDNSGFAGIDISATEDYGASLGVHDSTNDREWEFSMRGANLEDNNLALNYRDGGSYTRAMTLTSAADIGVGTTTPDSKLHIHNGDVKISNDTTYAGIAVHATEDYGASLGVHDSTNDREWEFSMRGANLETNNFALTHRDGGAYTRLITATSADGEFNIGIGTATPSDVAKLDVASTTQGFLPPRMTTTQRNLITAVEGLVIFNTTTKKLQCHDGTIWNDCF
jgi:hypothetical protein